MKSETTEWIAKADGDRKVAQRDMLAPDPVWDVICFLAQQCAEKYLKAFLEENNITFQKTHDLVVLFNTSGGLLTELSSEHRSLAYLSAFGIAARYPGAQADRRAATDSLHTAELVRTVVRSKLGLS